MPDDLPVARRMELAATRCRGCWATITFCTTDHGVAQPVNTAPDSTGNLIVTYDPVRVVLRSRVDQALLEPPGAPDERYMPHHATCPAADQYRRR